MERIVQRASGPHHPGLQLGSGQIWTHMTWTDQWCYRLGLFDLYPAHRESWKPHKIWVRLDGYWEPKIGVPKSQYISNGLDLPCMIRMRMARIIKHDLPLTMSSMHGSHLNSVQENILPWDYQLDSGWNSSGREFATRGDLELGILGLDLPTGNLDQS